MNLINWGRYQAAADSSFCDEIARWRGWPREFVDWCVASGYLGSTGSGVAFPVRDGTGNLVGVHVRSLGDYASWHYDPTGLKPDPTVYGCPGPNKFGYIAESTWDALSILLAWDFHLQPEAAKEEFFVIVTRGAQGGRSVARVLPAGGYLLAALMQNDPPRQDGSPTPAEKWFGDVTAALGGKPGRIDPPAGFKDLNDWIKQPELLPLIRKELTTNSKWCAIKGTAGDRDGATPPLSDGQPSDSWEPPGEFPVDCLPPLLQKYVREVARLEQVDEALPAVAVLGVISAALGKRPRTNLIRPRITSANLYLVALVPAGAGKSTVLGRVARALRKLDNELLAQWERERKPQILARLRAIERARKRQERADRQVPQSAGTSEAESTTKRFEGWEAEEAALRDELQKEPRLLADDITPERAVMILANELGTLSLMSSEPGDSIEVLGGRYHKGGQTRTNTLLLKGFSLEPHIADRVGRPSVRLPEPCLTVLYLMQPFVFRRLVDDEVALRSGLLARLLVAHIDDTPVAKLSDPEEDRQVLAAFDHLVEQLAHAFRLVLGSVMIPASLEAQELFDEYCVRTKQAAQAGPAEFAPLAARYAEQACRLAIVIHCATHGPTAPEVPIDTNTAGAAIQIVQWFSQHQRALFHNSIEVATHSEEERVRAWFATDPKLADGRGYSARDIRRRLHVAFGNELIEKLVKAGLIVVRRNGDTGGRPRVEFFLAPQHATAGQ